MKIGIEAASFFADIKMSDSEMKKMGIVTGKQIGRAHV